MRKRRFPIRLLGLHAHAAQHDAHLWRAYALASLLLGREDLALRWLRRGYGGSQSDVLWLADFAAALAYDGRLPAAKRIARRRCVACVAPPVSSRARQPPAPRPRPSRASVGPSASSCAPTSACCALPGAQRWRLVPGRCPADHDGPLAGTGSARSVERQRRAGQSRL